ncbi:MAG: ABC transporter ATP-binding protein, partial [Caldilineae bacterium]
EALEAQITQWEAEHGALQAQINAAGDDYTRIQTLAAALAELEASLDEAFDRWSELAERAENGEN